MYDVGLGEKLVCGLLLVVVCFHFFLECDLKVLGNGVKPLFCLFVFISLHFRKLLYGESTLLRDLAARCLGS